MKPKITADVILATVALFGSTAASSSPSGILAATESTDGDWTTSGHLQLYEPTMVLARRFNFPVNLVGALT